MFIFPLILTNLGLNQLNQLDVLVSHIHNIEKIPLEEVMAPVFLGLPWWLSGKESVCNAGNVGLIPELGRSPAGGHGNPLQYSCLENSMNRGSWQVTVHGVAKSQTRLNDFQCHYPKFHREDNLSQILHAPNLLEHVLSWKQEGEKVI